MAGSKVNWQGNIFGGTNPQIGGNNAGAVNFETGGNNSKGNQVPGADHIKGNHVGVPLDIMSANQANVQSYIHGGTNPQIAGDNMGPMNFGAGGNNKKGNQVQGADHIKTENQEKSCHNTKSGIQANIQSNIHGGTNPQIAGDNTGPMNFGAEGNNKKGNQVQGADHIKGNK